MNGCPSRDRPGSVRLPCVCDTRVSRGQACLGSICDVVFAPPTFRGYGAYDAHDVMRTGSEKFGFKPLAAPVTLYGAAIECVRDACRLQRGLSARHGVLNPTPVGDHQRVAHARPQPSGWNGRGFAMNHSRASSSSSTDPAIEREAHRAVSVKLPPDSPPLTPRHLMARQQNPYAIDAPLRGWGLPIRIGGVEMPNWCASMYIPAVRRRSWVQRRAPIRQDEIAPDWRCQQRRRDHRTSAQYALRCVVVHQLPVRPVRRGSSPQSLCTWDACQREAIAPAMRR